MEEQGEHQEQLQPNVTTIKPFEGGLDLQRREGKGANSLITPSTEVSGVGPVYVELLKDTDFGDPDLFEGKIGYILGSDGDIRVKPLLSLLESTARRLSVMVDSDEAPGSKKVRCDVLAKGAVPLTGVIGEDSLVSYFNPDVRLAAENEGYDLFVDENDPALQEMSIKLGIIQGGEIRS